MTEETVANSIIEQALKDAGVAPRDIHPETVSSNGAGKVEPDKLPQIPALPKIGETKNGEIETITVPTTTPKSSEPTVATNNVSLDQFKKMMEEQTRSIQSMTDKKLAQIEKNVQAINQSIADQKKAKEDAELESLPPDEKRFRKLELELQRSRNPQTSTVQSNPQLQQQIIAITYQRCLDMADTAGLSIEDSRLDWCKELTSEQVDPVVVTARFKASVKKALTEDTKKAIDSVTQSGLKKIRKQSGIDHVSTSGSSGSGTPDIDKLSPAEKIAEGFRRADIANRQNQ